MEYFAVGLPPAEIADRVGGVSKERVQKILDKAGAVSAETNQRKELAE
jgi:hypothetical protein